MRHLYLIRHAMPDIPLGERWCIGRTDLPLGTVGHMQAALLPFVPELRDKPVFCSYLKRSIETAMPLCSSPMIRPGLEEQDMGVWDGLSFTEIQLLYPELYAAREKNPSLMPSDAEPMDSVRSRMQEALRHCMEETEGDLVVVTHKSAIDSLTGQRPKLLHTSISVLDEDLRPLEIGLMPQPPLTEEVCMALLHAAETPQQVIDHCRAVAEEALRLSDGRRLDRELLFASAMLHDIARTRPNHAALGASWIRALGYPEVADVIAQHHDLQSSSPDEAAVLFLADKYLQGDRRVTLEQRFAASRDGCATEEAKAAHNRRYEMAKAVERLLTSKSS